MTDLSIEDMVPGSPAEVAANVATPAPSRLEAAVIGAVSRLPGFGGLAASQRTLVAFRGGTWTMIGYGAGQFLKLASTLVLARLVVPQAFGLVALVNVFLSGLGMLSDLGIGMDVVHHKRGDDPAFLNTAFLIQVGRGTILFAIAAGLAYPFASFYHQPAILALALVGSLSVLIQGITSSSLWTLTRNVRLREITILNMSTDFFGFVVSVIWAIISPTAWSLVAGDIAAVVALTIASHMISKNPVSLKWDKLAAKDIFLFGSGILFSTATSFLAGEGGRLVVGKFVTLVEFACFALALSISAAAGRGLTQVILQVFFPMISDSVRQNPEGAVGHFKRTRYLVCLLSICMAVGFIFASKLVVRLLLGPKYEMAGWMLQLLGVMGSLEFFMSLTAYMLFALGTSRYAVMANISKLVFLGVGLTIAFSKFGFHQALWVLALAPLTNYPPLLIGLRRYWSPVLRAELTSFSAFAAITALAMVLCGMFW